MGKAAWGIVGLLIAWLAWGWAGEMAAGTLGPGDIIGDLLVKGLLALFAIAFVEGVRTGY